jgi:hypothetical protein
MATYTLSDLPEVKVSVQGSNELTQSWTAFKPN